jgi:hypothetical protein
MGRLVRGVTDLATVRPDLASEWHPTANGDLAPGDVIAGTARKVWWLCCDGHEWQASCGQRYRLGSGCPYCSGNLVVLGINDLATTDPALAATWHPTKNGPLNPTQVLRSSNKSAWWLCPRGHEWSAAIYSRTGGRNCPYCSNQKVLAGFNDLATTDPAIAATWHPTKNESLAPTEVTRSTHKKVWWLCSRAHAWESTVGHRTNNRGCPYCAGQKVLAGFNDLATTDPAIAATWHPTKNESLAPTEVTRSTHKKVWWLCSIGHEWPSAISDRTRGSNCPYCAGKKVLAGFNDLVTTDPELAAEWHQTKNVGISAEELNSGSNKKVWWVCQFGHEWKTAPNERSRGRGCPRCAASGYDATSAGYLYLLQKEHLDLQQFGVTNYPDDRLATHRRNGWEVLDIIGPADGYWIVETETALGRFFKSKSLLLPRDYPDKFDGYSESWYSDELSFSTCAEMLEALRDWET